MAAAGSVWRARDLATPELWPLGGGFTANFAREEFWASTLPCTFAGSLLQELGKLFYGNSDNVRRLRHRSGRGMRSGDQQFGWDVNDVTESFHAAP
ncbi:hypothetical protein MTP99_003195 [Tenebrio molitor]|jgi:hypothetical protein|nr:hypothetical protein MTP99_003195 [Tenebrio molitor]